MVLDSRDGFNYVRAALGTFESQSDCLVCWKWGFKAENTRLQVNFMSPENRARDLISAIPKRLVCDFLKNIELVN